MGDLASISGDAATPRLPRTLELEDLLLALVIAVLPTIPTDGLLKPVLAIAYLTQLAWLGTRTRGAAPSLMRRVLSIPLSLIQLAGLPLFATLLRARDDGEEVLLWAVLICAVPVIGLSWTRYAPTLGRGLRRGLALPLVLLNGWYGTEYLVEKYFLDQGSLRLAAQAMSTPISGLALAAALTEAALASAIFLLLPYAVLVAVPRLQVSGDHDGLWTWVRRYGIFICAVVASFVLRAHVLSSP